MALRMVWETSAFIGDVCKVKKTMNRSLKIFLQTKTCTTFFISDNLILCQSQVT